MSEPIGGTMTTDVLDQLCEDYLGKLERGDCAPGEQGTASVVIRERIRLLKNYNTALQARRAA
jgi:hypothetical protein